ncbi:hypothetical protein ACFSKN_13680 [Mariniflexile gromovii]|uniref:Glutamine cyclotransferase n=1 Tax=Mariniflexile gromovii TaxID=362523 RepID=A0ABS4BR12_9FLAO|nr:hypothetical protein [Mariniflexile gromovii]MBP0903019.1 hypothetical protein [Mariniflexile gromovii]
MKYALYLLVFLSLSVSSQEFIETSLIGETELDADTFLSTNNFDTTFYILDNVLFKHSKETKGIDIGYSNFQLGNIYSVNTFNPLKINIFYKDFNTVIVLDNRLAEIFKIDFNALPDYKNVSHVATGSDNTIWIFNENTQQLELFDYKTKTKRAQTLPIKSTVLDIKSNYNNCWVLTEKQLFVYDYFGNLLKKIKNHGYTSIEIDNENIIFKKDNALFYMKKDSGTIVPINLPNLLINQFYVTNETLYIYHKENLQKYQLKIN